MKSNEELYWAVSRIIELNHGSTNQDRLKAAFKNRINQESGIQDIPGLLREVGDFDLQFVDKPTNEMLPLLAYSEDIGWGVITDTSQDGYSVFWMGGQKYDIRNNQLKGPCVRLKQNEQTKETGKETFLELLKKSIGKVRGIFFEVALATLFINALALIASLFSMQVYDRVIPIRSENTLIVLASGVVLVILVEWLMKIARAAVMDDVIVKIDSLLSRDIFAKLLSVRLDQMPASLGTLTAQIRGYEQIRSFYTTSTLFAAVDVPMALIFLIFISVVGSPWIALVPMVACLASICLGIYTKKEVERHAALGARASNRKTGILVEAIEGAETIRSGSAGWKFLSNWIEVNEVGINSDTNIRHATDSANYFVAAAQQLSYTGIICIGAWFVMEGHITMGALVACSILGGRVIAPTLSIPTLIVQQAHAKAAGASLEKLYQLASEFDDVKRPLSPKKLTGHYSLSDVKFSYQGIANAISIDRLEISPGERIAILGPIGSGKSTLLRLLTGMYKPQKGQVRLDGLDISQIGRESMSRNIGYLQQEQRLIHGSLRENLLMGHPDPGDEEIHQALLKTGLIELVSAHPRGLEMTIGEGGQGLSGGQKQLVAFTRLVLHSPEILLLDEPTAAMDGNQEQRCLSVIKSEINSGKTVVVVTHKLTILPLVERLIICVGHQIVLDGPRDEVLAQMNRNTPTVPKSTAGMNGNELRAQRA